LTSKAAGEKEEEERKATQIKSRDPHLAGGEMMNKKTAPKNVNISLF
jgi:hypothetical protein